MAFTDLNFISRFLPIFLIIYFISPKKYRLPVLFCGSMIFYCTGDFRFLIVLLLLCGINYIFSIVNWGSRIHNRENKKRTLTAVMLIDVGVLLLFKILNIYMKLSLPLGLSFYVFKMISYQADIYRGKVEKPASLLTMATYFSLFFQIAQGPIMRYEAEDFSTDTQRISLMDVEDGLKLFIMGLSMKVLLADRLAILWNETVKNGFESLSTGMAWFAAIGYAGDLYFDFWGYSLMAAGIGMMLGFRFVENFHHPYAARSVGDFYRRWHMTLTSWFKDYVYIPLGGSRKGTFKTILNIGIVWLLTGFWHGGGVHFILWGVMLGVIIIIERFLLKDFLDKHLIYSHFHVIFIMPLTWAVFAISDMRDVGTMLLKMLPVTGGWQGINPSDFAYYFNQFWVYFAVGIILCIPGVYEMLTKRYESKIKYIQAVIFAVLLWVSLYFSYTTQSNPFLYFYF